MEGHCICGTNYADLTECVSRWRGWVGLSFALGIL